MAEKKFDKVNYDRAYVEKNYDRISVTVKKGKKETITEHANKKGESVNAFINRAVDEAIERES